jgi:hypothetical protein
MNVGYTFFNLGEKLQHQFPHVSLTIINSGVNGDKIADMKARMYTDVVDQKPDAVLIYWDSDVSDLSLEIIEVIVHLGYSQYDNVYSYFRLVRIMYIEGKL